MEKTFSPSSGWVAGLSEAPKPPDQTLAKAFKVYNFIVAKGGEIELSSLVKHPSPLQKFSETQALEWLKEFADQKETEHLEKPSFACNRDSQGKIIVRVWIRVKLCSTYEKNGCCVHGVACLQWHVCRGFLEGNCTEAELCSRSHNLFDDENSNKSKKYMLEKHSLEVIRKVLAKNLPLVCEAYINKKCEDERCPNLHLCPLYVRESCENQYKSCPLGLSHVHNSPQNNKIFRNFAVPAKYSLSHVLLPKRRLPESQEQCTGNTHMESQGKRRQKVGNLNNLNAEDGGSQSSKLVAENVPLNIRPANSKDAKKAGKNKNQELLEKSKQRGQKEKKATGPQSNPQALMTLRLAQDTPYSVDAISDSYHPSARVDQSLAQHGPRRREFSSGGARPKMFQQNMGATGNQNNEESIDDKDIKYGEGVTEPCTKENTKKTGERKRGGKKGMAEGTALLEKSVSMEGLSKDVTAPVDQNNQPKKGRTRRRGNRQQNDRVSDSAEPANGNQEQEEENEIDLIKFGDEEGKLIDLDFDSDQSLSQLSETQDSQAMWDLFSQDQFYSFDDLSLSQPAEPDPLLDSHPSEDLAQSSSVTTDQIKNASERGVFNCIVVEYGGIAKFSEISKHPQLWDPCFTDQKKWFRYHKSSFLLVEDSRGNIEEVKAISLRAKLCFKYNGKSCSEENCPFFHVCKEFIAKGRCSNFGGSCKQSHGLLKDSHNNQIVSRLFPGCDFTNKQVKQLIQSSTPQVCLDYNNQGCKRGKKCTRIHVCKNYGHKRCQKSMCKLAHENALNNPATKALFDRFRIRIPPNMKLFMVAKAQLLVCEDERTPSAAVRKPSSDVSAKEKLKPEIKVPPKADYQIKSPYLDHNICLAFLLGQCRNGNKCTDHHCRLPYQWIYMTGKNWMMLDEKENTDLEKSFCENIDVDQRVLKQLKLDLSTAASKLSHQHNISYIYSVDLKKMEIGLLDDDDNIQFQLKRLSTESQVLIPECPLSTTWYWYWKDENGIYVEYQPSLGSKDPTSSSIEKFYQEGLSKYGFTVGNHEYQLYFTEMYQKNMDPKYSTKRDVIRRPKFTSPERVAQLKKTCKLPTPDSREIPQHWKNMAESQEFRLKKLNKNSKEFKEIQSLFQNSMGDKQPHIGSINRVQNPFMWEKYQRKKSQMEKLLDSKQVDERSLFHGTSYENIRPICKHNFDWRLYGKITGNIYGEGAYFARDASFSHCYCHDDDDGTRYVFVAKVLVGSFTKGEKIDRRPPHKDPSDPHSNLFDSCVDDANSPQVFVVFDVDQYYPGYIIEYTCHPTEYPSGPSSMSGLHAPYPLSQSATGQSGSKLPSSAAHTRPTSYSASGISSYPPSQSAIGHSGSTLPPNVIHSNSASYTSSDSSSYSPNQPLQRSISTPAPHATPTTHAYNPSPSPYSPSQSTSGPYRSMPPPNTSQIIVQTAADLSSRLMNEQIEKFARESKKSGESKKDCAVM